MEKEEKKEVSMENVIALLAEKLGESSENTNKILSQLIKDNEEIKKSTIEEDDPRYEIMLTAIREAREDLPEGQVATFELIGNKGKFYKMIPPRSRRVIKGHTFILRDATNYDSPFEDMQEDPIVMGDTIALDEGTLDVNPNDICRRVYLMLHKDNARNGGKVFQLRDVKRDRANKGKFAKIREQALDILKELDLNQMKAIALHATDEPINQIFQYDEDGLYGMLQDIAIARPNDIIEAKSSRKVEAAYYFGLALVEGIIKYNPDKEEIVWTRNGATMLNCSREEDPATKFANYIFDDVKGKGTELLEKIKDKVQ